MCCCGVSVVSLNRTFRGSGLGAVGTACDATASWGSCGWVADAGLLQGAAAAKPHAGVTVLGECMLRMSPTLRAWHIASVEVKLP